MRTTRRHFLAGAGAGLLGAALLGTAGCGRGNYITKEGTLSLWYWDRSISDTLLAEVPKVTGTPLVTQKISTDYKSKLLTSLAGNAYIPDICAFNDDVATYFPDAEAFWDLNELGAAELEDQYLDWKWKFGTTPEGRFIGFPMDTGPTALFYREDLFKAAGLPSEPEEVATELDTWEKYFDAAEEYQKASGGKYLIPNVDMVYYQAVRQQGTRYMTEENRFIGDGPQIRGPWELAVEAHRRKLTANAAPTRGTDWNAAVSNGTVASFVDAVWNAEIMKDTTPNTSGKWRVCRAPGGPGNAGGSFIGITKASRDPEAAWETIKWVQSPENQIRAYNEISLFPAAKAALGSEEVRVPNEFFGGQIINDVFGESALHVKPVYLSPYDSLIDGAFNAEITNIWAAGKDPERAWRDALDEVERQLAHRGVI